jgi:hypothetical protein
VVKEAGKDRITGGVYGFLVQLSCSFHGSQKFKDMFERGGAFLVPFFIRLFLGNMQWDAFHVQFCFRPRVYKPKFLGAQVALHTSF